MQDLRKQFAQRLFNGVTSIRSIFRTYEYRYRSHRL
jgi:hypothetical protein